MLLPTHYNIVHYHQVLWQKKKETPQFCDLSIRRLCHFQNRQFFNVIIRKVTSLPVQFSIPPSTVVLSKDVKKVSLQNIKKNYFSTVYTCTETVMRQVSLVAVNLPSFMFNSSFFSDEKSYKALHFPTLQNSAPGGGNHHVSVPH